jgi:hypothetical protein
LNDIREDIANQSRLLTDIRDNFSEKICHTSQGIANKSTLLNGKLSEIIRKLVDVQQVVNRYFAGITNYPEEKLTDRK